MIITYAASYDDFHSHFILLYPEGRESLDCDYYGSKGKCMLVRVEKQRKKEKRSVCYGMKGEQLKI